MKKLIELYNSMLIHKQICTKLFTIYCVINMFIKYVHVYITWNYVDGFVYELYSSSCTILTDWYISAHL